MGLRRLALSFGFGLLGAAVLGCSDDTGTTPGADAGPSLTDLGARDTGPGDVGQVLADRPDAGPADSGQSTASCGMLGRCNYVTNSGCAAGEGCYAAREMANGPITGLCVTPGTRGWGERCTSVNDCREGFACLGDPGECTKLCCGTDNTSCRDESRGGRPGAVCAGTITGLDARYCISVVSCDPYATANNRCAPSTPRCDPIAADGTTNCFAQQSGVTPGTDGTPCCVNTRCAPGFACVGTDPAACNTAAPNRVCRRVCNPDTEGTDAGTACPANQRCSLRFRDLPSTFAACQPQTM
ncbi:MAG: hypothetical protein JNK72_16500 [Myxococcales bacterium]|nr:hypothetical protein [Myxococcales bacterium]